MSTPSSSPEEVTSDNSWSKRNPHLRPYMQAQFDLRRRELAAHPEKDTANFTHFQVARTAAAGNIAKLFNDGADGKDTSGATPLVAMAPGEAILNQIQAAQVAYQTGLDAVFATTAKVNNVDMTLEQRVQLLAQQIQSRPGGTNDLDKIRDLRNEFLQKYDEKTAAAMSDWKTAYDDPAYRDKLRNSPTLKHPPEPALTEAKLDELINARKAELQKFHDDQKTTYENWFKAAYDEQALLLNRTLMANFAQMTGEQVTLKFSSDGEPVPIPPGFYKRPGSFSLETPFTYPITTELQVKGDGSVSIFVPFFMDKKAAAKDIVDAALAAAAANPANKGKKIDTITITEGTREMQAAIYREAKRRGLEVKIADNIPLEKRMSAVEQDRIDKEVTETVAKITAPTKAETSFEVNNGPGGQAIESVTLRESLKQLALPPMSSRESLEAKWNNLGHETIANLTTWIMSSSGDADRPADRNEAADFLVRHIGVPLAATGVVIGALAKTAVLPRGLLDSKEVGLRIATAIADWGKNPINFSSAYHANNLNTEFLALYQDPARDPTAAEIRDMLKNQGIKNIPPSFAEEASFRALLKADATAAMPAAMADPAKNAAIVAAANRVAAARAPAGAAAPTPPPGVGLGTPPPPPPPPPGPGGGAGARPGAAPGGPGGGAGPSVAPGGPGPGPGGPGSVVSTPASGRTPAGSIVSAPGGGGAPAGGGRSRSGSVVSIDGSVISGPAGSVVSDLSGVLRPGRIPVSPPGSVISDAPSAGGAAGAGAGSLISSVHGDVKRPDDASSVIHLEEQEPSAPEDNRSQVSNQPRDVANMDDFNGEQDHPDYANDNGSEVSSNPDSKREQKPDKEDGNPDDNGSVVSDESARRPGHR